MWWVYVFVCHTDPAWSWGFVKVPAHCSASASGGRQEMGTRWCVQWTVVGVWGSSVSDTCIDTDFFLPCFLWCWGRAASSEWHPTQVRFNDRGTPVKQPPAPKSPRTSPQVFCCHCHRRVQCAWHFLVPPCSSGPSSQRVGTRSWSRPSSPALGFLIDVSFWWGVATRFQQLISRLFISDLPYFLICRFVSS